MKTLVNLLALLNCGNWFVTFHAKHSTRHSFSCSFYPPTFMSGQWKFRMQQCINNYSTGCFL